MTALPWGLAAAALAALLALAVAVLFLFRESRRALALDRRLQAVRAQAVSAYDDSGKRQEEASGASYLSAAVVAALRVAAILVPVGAAERAKIGMLLGQAGFRQRDALAVFLSLKMVLMLAAGAAAGMLASEADLLGGSRIAIGFAGLAGAVAGGLLPEAALRRLGARRHRKLSRALPDALDLMALCVEAGYTFERAISVVSRELRSLAPELAEELGSVEAQLRLGADRRTVLQDLCERAGAEGLRDFAMTVIQGEHYGTPMSQSIQNIAQNERMQRAARIEAAAGRLPVIMSLPMLLLVVPGIILLMGGPAFLVMIQALSKLGAN